MKIIWLFDKFIGKANNKTSLGLKIRSKSGSIGKHLVVNISILKNHVVQIIDNNENMHVDEDNDNIFNEDGGNGSDDGSISNEDSDTEG